MLGQWFLRSSWCGCGCSSRSWRLGNAIEFLCLWNQVEQQHRFRRVWMSQNSWGVFLWEKSLLHLLLLLLKSHIQCFDSTVLVTSMSILPLWKARWQCQAPWQGTHTRWEQHPSSPSLPAKLRASISPLIALIRERGGVNWKTLGSRLFAGRDGCQ